MPELSPFGDPIDDPVPGWSPPPRPSGETMAGRLVRVEKLRTEHAPALHAANTALRNWTYLPYGPFETEADYTAWVAGITAEDDPLFHAVIDLATGEAVGIASYLRIAPAAGSIEVGHIHFSPKLQQTPGSTEAMFLMMRWAFEAGYRRYEWKCNALNAPSRRAAQRLGLSYEGVFRQAAVVKGRNRDTAWYAAIDAEWPQLRAAFETWLAPENFEDGQQKQSLSALTAPILVARG